MRVEWREVRRSFRERGLVFFGKRTFALDPAIDLQADAVRAALAALIPLRDEPPGGYARLTLDLYPSGYDRPPVQERTEFDPRRAILRAELATKEGEPAADHDRVEALVEWPAGEDVEPVLVRAITMPGAATRERVRRAALGPVRERLEAARAGASAGAVLEWRGPGGTRLALRARLALLALADLAHRAAPEEADRLRALAAEVEAAPGGPYALEDPPGDPARERGWLRLLVGRKRTLGKSVASYHCPACQAEHPGETLAEHEFDRRDGFFGERGLAFSCPRGHEVARIVEETA